MLQAASRRSAHGRHLSRARQQPAGENELGDRRGADLAKIPRRSGPGRTHCSPWPRGREFNGGARPAIAPCPTSAPAAAQPTGLHWVPSVTNMTPFMPFRVILVIE